MTRESVPEATANDRRAGKLALMRPVTVSYTHLTDATLAQSQQSAQDAGATQEQVGSMLDQSKRDAASSLGGLAP